jgi:hypothetical protein
MTQSKGRGIKYWLELIAIPTGTALTLCVIMQAQCNQARTERFRLLDKQEQQSQKKDQDWDSQKHLMQVLYNERLRLGLMYRMQLDLIEKGHSDAVVDLVQSKWDENLSLNPGSVDELVKLGEFAYQGKQYNYSYLVALKGITSTNKAGTKEERKARLNFYKKMLNEAIKKVESAQPKLSPTPDRALYRPD